jgi:uncharacterized membrane protein YeaQ/YmgE (transglycosylase-associated protein family)
MIGTVFGILVIAFITGALARLAVPGPDPMPAWLTILIGLVGSVIGGAVALAIWGRDPYVINTASFVAAVLLVIAYRRFVQKRPVFGRDALRFPKRGVGVPQYRERLRRAGVDPDKLPFEELAELRQQQQAPAAPPAEDGTPPSPRDDLLTPEERTEALRRLLEKRDAGELSETEYRERRHRIVYGEDG